MAFDEMETKIKKKTKANEMCYRVQNKQPTNSGRRRDTENLTIKIAIRAGLNN